MTTIILLSIAYCLLGVVTGFLVVKRRTPLSDIGVLAVSLFWPIAIVAMLVELVTRLYAEGLENLVWTMEHRKMPKPPTAPYKK